ncbi:MAG: hypothetical protein ACE5R6_08785 [Candidatus Heimdallarchaeota archaeon]
MQTRMYPWVLLILFIFLLSDSLPIDAPLNRVNDDPTYEIEEQWDGPAKGTITIAYGKGYGVVCRDIQTGGKIYFAVNPSGSLTIYLSHLKYGSWYRWVWWEHVNTPFYITCTVKAGTWGVLFVNVHEDSVVQLHYEVDYWKGDTSLPPYRFIVRSPRFQLFMGHLMFLIFLASVWVLTGKKQQGHFHLDFHKGDQTHAYERIRAQFLSDFPTSTIIKEAPPTDFQYNTGGLEGSLTISSQEDGGKIKGTVQRPSRKTHIYFYIALYLAGAFFAGYGVSGALLYILGTLIMVEVPLAFIYSRRIRSTCKTMANSLKKALL